MSIASLLPLGQTALELGLICSLTVLSLFLSYTMLNVCDLSTDGCFTLGATVGAVVALAGHPYLAILAAMGAGVLSGFTTAFLQTKMGIESLLSGIQGGVCGSVGHVPQSRRCDAELPVLAEVCSGTAGDGIGTRCGLLEHL